MSYQGMTFGELVYYADLHGEGATAAFVKLTEGEYEEVWMSISNAWYGIDALYSMVW